MSTNNNTNNTNNSTKNGKKLRGKQNNKNSHARLHGTTGEETNLETHLEVYSQDHTVLYIVPRLDVVSMPRGKENAFRNLQICPDFANAPEDGGNNGGCSRHHCPFVHARLANSKSHQVHVNLVWSSLEDCTIERFASEPDNSSSMITVSTPNAAASARTTIPREHCLKTACLDTPRATHVHCAHYYFNQTCNRGSQCTFVHAVSVCPDHDVSSSSSSCDNQEATTNNKAAGEEHAMCVSQNLCKVFGRPRALPDHHHNSNTHSNSKTATTKPDQIQLGDNNDLPLIQVVDTSSSSDTHDRTNKTQRHTAPNTISKFEQSRPAQLGVLLGNVSTTSFNNGSFGSQISSSESSTPASPQTTTTTTTRSPGKVSALYAAFTTPWDELSTNTHSSLTPRSRSNSGCTPSKTPQQSTLSSNSSVCSVTPIDMPLQERGFPRRVRRVQHNPYSWTMTTELV